MPCRWFENEGDQVRWSEKAKMLPADSQQGYEDLSPINAQYRILKI